MEVYKRSDEVEIRTGLLIITIKEGIAQVNEGNVKADIVIAHLNFAGKKIKVDNGTPAYRIMRAYPKNWH